MLVCEHSHSGVEPCSAVLWVPTFTSAGPGFAEDTVFVGRMGAVDLVGGWSAVRGVFKNSGTAGDTEVNWWERQRETWP